jgi:DNA polymerase III delta prime subunit
MDEGELKQILFELQSQNRELLERVMRLEVSNYQMQQQFTSDLYQLSCEIYAPKEVESTKELLESKRFIMEEMNAMRSKEIEKLVAKFEEDIDAMEETIAKIVR